MSRYLGPKVHVVRRLGKIPSFTFKSSRRVPLVSQRANARNTRYSQYSIRLKEKQRLRFFYGIGERQLLNYFKKAKKKKGSSGVELLLLLEMRLDNIVYRMGVAPTIFSSRQLIIHRHLLLNGLSINIPSILCPPSSIIGVVNSTVSKSLVMNNLSYSRNKFLPANLSFNGDKLEGKVLNLASRSSLIILINELLVVEYYSRKI